MGVPRGAQIRVGGMRPLHTAEAPANQMSSEHRRTGPPIGWPQRDRELVRFAGVFGAVAPSHVMAMLGVRRTMAYEHAAVCVEAGYLERLDLGLRGVTAWKATRRGLRFAGLPYRVAVISRTSVGHWLQSTSTALALVDEFGADRVLSERELTMIERASERPVFSARLGETIDGAPRLHRPDLAVVGEGRPIVVEVELSPKAPNRLEAIIRAWRRAEWIEEIRYYCAHGPTRRGVERAILKMRAEGRVRVLDGVAL
jgi:hypothetical protein